ncbi:TerB family tellurite resistance protein [Mesorhizobium sp. BAC0120]|uniref:tellurite resistance TerB family protein n=1 Tax=Mesorhizobium sp. BAC0120 TaxID=3090670 RepID=UPI00298BF4F1|nr:TerB family tellurite resistance protein [Mesorhizobium sp. BAC0120]MDW6022116.1 TerB family tellurite resistance protein [Mesorhizobium sp. BAC0120]
MLDRLISFLKNLPEAGSSRRLPSAEDPRVAAAALMFHVVNADGVLQDVEKAKLRSVLSEAYSVTGGELDALIAAGEEADREAIDLYAFTRVLKRHLDADQRLQFIGLLWTMAYADGRADELEDNTVWRIAELIGVDSRDRIAARQHIKASIAGAADGPGVNE